MYNQQTEQLVDTTAHKLLNRLGIGSHEFPVEVVNLAGRMFAFNIRMPDYFNCDYDFHHHRVVRLSEIDATPSASLEARRPKKVWSIYDNVSSAWRLLMVVLLPVTSVPG